MLTMFSWGSGRCTKEISFQGKENLIITEFPPQEVWHWVRIRTAELEFRLRSPNDHF